jgi:plastocyanin
LFPLAFVACGGGTSSNAQSSSSSEATTTTTGSNTPCPPSAPLGPGAKDHGAVPAAGAQLSIQAGDVFFAPTCETGLHAGTITLAVHNSGQALHNVSIPDQNIDQDVAKGATITVNVTVGATPVAFFCKYHKAAGMVGALLPGP